MYDIYNCPHLGCGDCLYGCLKWSKDGYESECKRIDHKTVQFAKPWFADYFSSAHWHIPCSDFQPRNPDYADLREWTNFKDFWRAYVRVWLPYSNEDITLGFVLKRNQDIRYKVPLKRFVFGTMIKGNILRAVEKEHYTRSGTVYEKIDGVLIDSGRVIIKNDDGGSKT